MTRAPVGRLIHWYCKPSNLISLICDGNVHPMDIHSIRIKILQTTFSHQIYFQLFLLFIFSQDCSELFSVCHGLNYFLLDWLVSMAVGRKTFFIEKIERHFCKSLLDDILKQWFCILLVTQQQTQILNATFKAVEFSIQKNRTSVIWMRIQIWK